MRKIKSSKHLSCRAQTAIEYLLLLTIVAMVVFVGLKTTILPRIAGTDSSEGLANAYFKKIANSIINSW